MPALAWEKCMKERTCKAELPETIEKISLQTERSAIEKKPKTAALEELQRQI